MRRCGRRIANRNPLLAARPLPSLADSYFASPQRLPPPCIWLSCQQRVTRHSASSAPRSSFTRHSTSWPSLSSRYLDDRAAATLSQGSELNLQAQNGSTTDNFSATSRIAVGNQGCMTVTMRFAYCSNSAGSKLGAGGTHERLVSSTAGSCAAPGSAVDESRRPHTPGTGFMPRSRGRTPTNTPLSRAAARGARGARYSPA